MERRRRGACLAALILLAGAAVQGADVQPPFGKPDAGPPELPDADCRAEYDDVRRKADLALQGEFAGSLGPQDGWAQDCGAQVVALGCGRFHLVVYPGGLPGAGWRKTAGLYRVNGQTSEGVCRFEHAAGWKATIAGEALKFRDKSGADIGSLKRTIRESPTLGLKPPEGAIVLFDGTSAGQFLSGRIDPERRLIPKGATRQAFGDCTLHVEFLTPFAPELRGQGRCNSGVHMQGRYEIQVLDSFGLEGLRNECGGVYRIAGPAVNMCFPPLTWQTYDVEFTAPKFDADGFKMHNAEMTIRHNGVLVHDRLNVYRTTASDSPPEAPGPHPFSLQGRDPVVLYRNIWVVERAQPNGVPKSD